MSAVLHPTGPEGPRTYWIRRVLVLVVLALVVLVVLWAFLPDREDVRAVPGPAGTTARDGSPAADPSPGSGPTGDATPAETPGPTPTAEATPTDDTPTQGTPTQGTPTQGTPTEDIATEDTATPTPEREAAPAACTGAELRLDLDGSTRPEAGEDHDLEVALTNGSEEDCVLSLDRDGFELRVYSGTDRIWTTDHCERWLPVSEEDRETRLGAGDTRELTLTWPVRRSEEECALAEADLRPGTYVATARYADAEPAQLVMVLR